MCFYPARNFLYQRDCTDTRTHTLKDLDYLSAVLINLLLKIAITLWPLFSKIVGNFVVPSQPAIWAIQLKLCLKPQPLELFGPVQTTCYLRPQPQGPYSYSQSNLKLSTHVYDNPLPPHVFTLKHNFLPVVFTDSANCYSVCFCNNTQ